MVGPRTLGRVTADVPDLLSGIATTRAIRRFAPDPIPDEDLAAMLWHATRAPSGTNRQPVRFIVLRDGERAEAAKALLQAESTLDSVIFLPVPVVTSAITAVAALWRSATIAA